MFKFLTVVSVIISLIQFSTCASPPGPPVGPPPPGPPPPDFFNKYEFTYITEVTKKILADLSNDLKNVKSKDPATIGDIGNFIKAEVTGYTRNIDFLLGRLKSEISKKYQGAKITEANLIEITKQNELLKSTLGTATNYDGLREAVDSILGKIRQEAINLSDIVVKETTGNVRGKFAQPIFGIFDNTAIVGTSIIGKVSPDRFKPPSPQN